MNKINEAILKTVVYADIFYYPLTLEELQRYLIKTSKQRHSGEEPRQRRDKLRDDSRIKNGFWISQDDGEMLKLIQHDGDIETDGKYFFLKNRRKIVDLRKKREKWSREKLKLAVKAASWLKFIPWVKMVGITGSLAMNNSSQNDDIDFLIISLKNRIWLTRLVCTIIVELLGVRRHPSIGRHPREGEDLDFRLRGNDVSFKNKICLNMYLDEAHLEVPIQERDLFTAHEVVQVKRLWDRDQTYQKFLGENLWVKKYLPNTSFQRPRPCPRALRGVSARGGLMKPVAEFIFNLIENMAKNFQLWYMNSRRTTEVISDGVIRFHPQDVRKWVLKEYKQKLNRLDVAS